MILASPLSLRHIMQIFELTKTQTYNIMTHWPATTVRAAKNYVNYMFIIKQNVRSETWQK